MISHTRDRTFMTLFRTSRRVAALLAALTAGFVLQATVTSPAVATTSSRASGMQAPLEESSAATWLLWPGAHWCASTGFIDGYQGVICVNLEYRNYSGGRIFRAFLELKCGTDLETVKCTSAKANFVWATHLGDTWVETGRCVWNDPTTPCGPHGNRFNHPSTFVLLTGEIASFTIRGDARQGTGGFTLPTGQGYARVQPPTITITG